MVVALVCFTAYRVTRLLTRDTFPPIALARARLEERFGDGSSLAYLISCSWCTGVWVAGAVTAAAWWILGGLVAPFLVWPTAAVAAGFLGQVDYLMDRATRSIELRIPEGELE